MHYLPTTAISAHNLMNHKPCYLESNSPGPPLTVRKRTILDTLPAGTAAAGEANHSAITLDLACPTRYTRLVGRAVTFSELSRRPW